MIKIFVENKSGTMIDFAVAVNLMDDELRDELAEKMGPCEVKDFFVAYEEAHEKKFGEPWELSKANPVY